MKRFIPQCLDLCNAGFDYVRQRRYRVALGLFFTLCLNLAIAPALYAASDALSRGNAYALGLLSLVIVALAIYLTAVILNPERF